MDRHRSETTVGTAARPTFAPPPALASPHEVQVALREWAEAGSALGRPDLALALVAAAGPDPDRAGPDLARAGYLLEAGRFPDALAELGAAGVGRPARPDEVTFAEVLRASAEAALGDDAALGWLTTMASAHLHSEAAGLFATCLARVGRARGDDRLRDDAHRQLGRLGLENREVSPEVAALMIRERDQAEVEAAHTTLRDALGLLDRSSQSFATDPQPVLDAAAALVRDGDRPGAVLLLSWVHRLAPGSARVTAALRALPSRRPGPVRGLVLAVLWGVALAVALYGIVHSSPVFVAPLGLGVLGWHRYVRIRGLSLVDSRLYRRIRPVRADPYSREETVRFAVAGAVTFAVGLLGGLAVLDVLTTRRGVAWGELPPLVEVGVWTVALGLLPAAVGFVGWRLHRRGRAQAAVLRARERRLELVASNGRCRCWDATAVWGEAVEPYLESHLEVVPGPAALTPVREAHPEAGLETARCAQTGAVWLRLVQAPEGAAHLLRAPLGRGDAVTLDQSAEPATGFYL